MAESFSTPGRDYLSRRRFFAGAGAGAALAFAASPSAARAAKQGHNPPNVGSGALNLKARIYPISQPSNRGPYPEQALPRYSAAEGKWGVSFSGGGSRTYSAMLGQMRALENAGVLDNIGAISCVSGASWFGTPFTFAPRNFLDSTLLGPLVQPADITVAGLNQLPEDSLGARITNLTDTNLLAILAEELVQILEFKYIPLDKLYSRALNDSFLLPYGLANTDTLFTLNEESLQAIRARNPGLRAPFYLPRKGRPFLIIGGTQIYQLAQTQQTPVTQPPSTSTQQVFRSMEYTPLYSGAPQLVDQGAPTGLPYGGGYVESFAFDTPAPTTPATAANVATVPQGQYPFLLSDMMGSSSASVAQYVAQLAQDVSQYLPISIDPFPSFDYWPITKIGQVGAMEYDFGDGGILEDTGVVSLLRRGYRTIFAFVNSSVPIGPSCISVNGIDGQISRLFGYIPLAPDAANDGKCTTSDNLQSTQVFASEQYQSVVNGLVAAKQAGGVPVYADHFPVIEGNAFGIAPYTPKIFWIYNDRIESWFAQLPSTVLDLFNNTANNLQDFPNYKTFLEDTAKPLYLSPTQVNLLADMWAYGVSTGFARKGYAFGQPIN